jgi:hypothetical protein
MQTANLILKGKASAGCSLQLTLGAETLSAAAFCSIMETSHSCDQALCRRNAWKKFRFASDAPNNLELKQIFSEVSQREA